MQISGIIGYKAFGCVLKNRKLHLIKLFSKYVMPISYEVFLL